MQTYPLTLDSTGHSGAGRSDTFDLIDLGNFSSLSAAAAVALTEPRQLSMAHAATKKAGVTTHRGKLRLDMTKSDAVYGEQVLSGYLVLSRPGIEQTAIVEADVLNLVGQLIDFLTDSARMAKFLNREG